MAGADDALRIGAAEPDDMPGCRLSTDPNICAALDWLDQHADWAGDKRAEWTKDDQRTTLVLLVEGNFRVDLTEGSITMSRQGDYIVWQPGIDHSWEAISDSVVLTVRWPSAS